MLGRGWDKLPSELRGEVKSIEKITKIMKLKALRLMTATPLMLALSALPALAQSLSWDGADTSTTGAQGGAGTWDTTTANWWNGSTNVLWPTAGTNNDAVFGGTAGAVTVAAGGVTANDLTFDTTGYTLSGGTITLNGATPTLSAGSGISATISSTIASTTGVTKTGAGTVALSGNNSYTGTTTVSAGTLQYSGNNTLQNLVLNGTGAVADFSGGTTTVNSTGGGTFINGGSTLRISGGSLTYQGGGSWLNFDNGTITLDSGSFTSTNQWGVTANTAAGTININGGSFTANAISNNGIILGESASGNGILNLNGGTLITDQIRGGLGVGSINFNGGKLQSTGDLTDIIVNNTRITTTLLSGGLRVGGTPNFTISEVMVGTGGVTKEDSNTVTLSGANTFTGVVTVNGGTLIASFANGANNAVFSQVSGIVVNSGGTLRTTSNALFGWDGTQARTLTVNAGGIATTQAGNDANVGLVVLNGGELAGSQGAWAWGSWNFGRATEKTLRVTENSTVSATGVALTRGSFVEVAAGKTLNFTGTIINIPDAVSQWSKTGAGTMILGGTNTYTGTTTVTGGTLIVNGSIAANTTTTVQTGATIGGSGSVGNLTIAAGGSINPGNSPGALTVNGAYNQAGTLVAEITGLTAGTDHDQVRVNGSVTLSGSLSTMFTGGSYQVNDLIFLVLNDGNDGISGTFSGLAQDSYVTNYGGMDWFISYNADSVGNTFTGGNDVALRAVPEPSAALLGGLGALALLRRRRKDVA